MIPIQDNLNPMGTLSRSAWKNQLVNIIIDGKVKNNWKVKKQKNIEQEGFQNRDEVNFIKANPPFINPLSANPTKWSSTLNQCISYYIIVD